MNYYTIDKNKENVILDDTGFQVMMEWEKSYMEALVDNLNPVGDVLEIGFGLGYSARRILSKNVKSYTVIESDKEAIIRCRNLTNQSNIKVNIIEGEWQDQLQTLGKFDSIFFDDAPSVNFPDPNNIRIYKFYYDVLEKHAKVGTKLTWYCDTAIYWLSNPFVSFSNNFYNVKISDDCKYIETDTTLLSMPIVDYKFGIVSGMKRLALGNNFEVVEV